MLRQQLKFAGKGEDSTLLVFTPPVETVAPNSVEKSCMAIPVLPREGFFLLAIPDGFLTNDAILDAVLSEEDDVLGPSGDLTAPLVEEDDSGLEVSIGIAAKFLLIDVTDAAFCVIMIQSPIHLPRFFHMRVLGFRPS